MPSRPFSFSTDNSFLVHFTGDAGQYRGIGTALSNSTSVLSAEDLTGIDPAEYHGYDNTTITFPLELPSAAGVVENSDDWGLGTSGVSVDSLWALGFRGAGVRIGIADTGLDVTLPTFDQLRSENRLIAFAAFAPDGSKILQKTNDGSTIPDNSATPSASHWHGTFCSSILVGANDGFKRGVAPEASLAVARVLQQGETGTVASIFSGIDWLSKQGLDIISLSLGWPGKHEEWAVPIKSLLDAGIVVVVAVGNEWGIPGEDPSRSPANYPIFPTDSTQGILIAVGAHDQNGVVGNFSGGESADWSSVSVTNPDGTSRASVFSRSPPFKVPVAVAPGVAVVEPVAASAYFSEDGSSMATPHVAGMIAIVLSALRSTSPNAKPRDAAELLLSSLSNLPNNSNPTDIRAGRGRINIDDLLTGLRHITS